MWESLRCTTRKLWAMRNRRGRWPSSNGDPVPSSCTLVCLYSRISLLISSTSTQSRQFLAWLCRERISIAARSRLFIWSSGSYVEFTWNSSKIDSCTRPKMKFIVLKVETRWIFKFKSSAMHEIVTWMHSIVQTSTTCYLLTITIYYYELNITRHSMTSLE